MKNRIAIRLVLLTLSQSLIGFIELSAFSHLNAAEARVSSTGNVRKLEDIVIYEDSKFYGSFPSIVRRSNGELLVAFRRAPERRGLGESGTSHTDPNSYLVLVRSSDDGKTWSREPQLIFAHPFGGSQDPCMVQLQDGQILC